MTIRNFEAVANMIERTLDEGRQGMLAVGGAKINPSLQDIILGLGQRVDSILAALDGVVLVIRALDAVEVRGEPAPVPGPDPLRVAARALVESFISARASTGSAIVGLDELNALRAIVLELDGTVNAT